MPGRASFAHGPRADEERHHEVVEVEARLAHERAQGVGAPQSAQPRGGKRAHASRLRPRSSVWWEHRSREREVHDRHGQAARQAARASTRSYRPDGGRPRPRGSPCCGARPVEGRTEVGYGARHGFGPTPRGRAPACTQTPPGAAGRQFHPDGDHFGGRPPRPPRERVRVVELRRPSRPARSHRRASSRGGQPQHQVVATIRPQDDHEHQRVAHRDVRGFLRQVRPLGAQALPTSAVVATLSANPTLKVNPWMARVTPCAASAVAQGWR